MLKVNLAEVGAETFSSPKGTYQLQRRDISRHLIQKDQKDREPAFEIEHVILPSGKKNFPYHQHATWWELYFILSGDGTVRTETGYEKIEANDCFIFPPGDPHQIINDSSNDLTYLVIANNTPFLELSRLKFSLKIEKEYRTKKLVISRLTMDGIRGIYGRKCIPKFVQIRQRS